ncbi:agmatinase [Elongatibacter sediminis]|uniref:Agmatinase n=1 Tax=Elongatibacter sediminis TaxID=3119006 RepID=A0AAW9RFX4_9GAMM
MSVAIYRNPFTFLEVPWYRDCPEADVVITGIPFDMATSGRAGTRSGPGAIRQASANLVWDQPRYPWDFELSDRLRIADAGDVDFPYGEPQAATDAIQAHTRSLLEAGRTVLGFGGDHYVTLPLLREHARTHGPLALLHFDAHTDTDSEGTAFDHGAMFHHAVEEGLLLPEQSVQVGIRTTFSRAAHPFEVLDAAWVNEHSADEVSRRVREILGDRPVYLTFDIDCLDPAYAPGTGTPVAGGLSSDLALRIIRGLVGVDIRGMDVVEVSPAYDHAELTSLAAATLALEMLYTRAAGV